MKGCSIQTPGCVHGQRDHVTAVVSGWSQMKHRPTMTQQLVANLRPIERLMYAKSWPGAWVQWPCNVLWPNLKWTKWTKVWQALSYWANCSQSRQNFPRSGQKINTSWSTDKQLAGSQNKHVKLIQALWCVMSLKLLTSKLDLRLPKYHWQILTNLLHKHWYDWPATADSR